MQSALIPSVNKVAWRAPIASLDLHRLLPVFFDGIREKDDPYRFLAVQGVRRKKQIAFVSEDLAYIGSFSNKRVVPWWGCCVVQCCDILEASGRRVRQIVPQLVMPLKRALNTRDPEVCLALPSRVLFFGYFVRAGRSPNAALSRRLPLAGHGCDAKNNAETHLFG